MSEDALASQWLVAARDPQISGELELVYAKVARETERQRPVCRASGECCNFEKWGHRLYVTGLEAAYTLVNLDFEPVGAPSGSDRSMNNGAAHPSVPLRALKSEHVAAARARGGCPFQVGLLCGVHTIKPLGCRVYFCDPTAQDWQRSLSEAALADIRAIHEAHAIPYLYGEWRGMLESLVGPA